MQNTTEQPLKARKTRDRAIILPLIGLLLLVPPIGQIFEIHVRLNGLPFIWLYVFAVWAALIAGAFLLSKRLGDESDPRPGELPEQDHPARDG
ncbi:MAG: hypothetical protein P8X75_12975 [Limibacillus sp.]|jgi:hypothetical protein